GSALWRRAGPIWSRARHMSLRAKRRKTAAAAASSPRRRRAIISAKAPLSGMTKPLAIHGAPRHYLRCAGTPQALILPGAAFFCGAGPDFVWNSWPGWASVPDFLLIGAPLASTECRVGILGCPHAILPQDGCFLAGALAARSRRVLCHTKMPRPEFPRVVGCDRSAPARLATPARPT